MIQPISDEKQDELIEALRKQNDDLNNVDDPTMDVFSNFLFFVPIPV